MATERATSLHGLASFVSSSLAAKAIDDSEFIKTLFPTAYKKLASTSAADTSATVLALDAEL